MMAARMPGLPAALALLACGCGDGLALPPPDAAAPAALSIEPATLDLGEVGTCAPPPVTSLVVTNTGGRSTGLIDADLDGPDAERFELVGGCRGVVLAPGTSCTVGVAPHWPVIGGCSEEQRATLDVADDRVGARADLRYLLACDGFATLAPTSHDFGTVAIGATSAARAFVLGNAGNCVHHLRSTRISGPDGADFVLSTDGCSGIDLAPGDTCEVRVYFGPKAAGARSGALELRSTSGSSVAAVLSGTGG